MRRERGRKSHLRYGAVRKRRPPVGLQLFSHLCTENYFLLSFSKALNSICVYFCVMSCYMTVSAWTPAVPLLSIGSTWLGCLLGIEWFLHCWKVSVRRPLSLVAKLPRMTCWCYRKSWNSGLFISLHSGLPLLGAHSWLLSCQCGELGLPLVYSCCWAELFFSVMVTQENSGSGNP